MVTGGSMKAFAMTIFLTIFASAASAASSEQREVWLSQSSFDGRIFSYKYIAYDTEGPVVDEARIECSFGEFEDQRFLKSVRVRLVMEAPFDKAGAQIEKSGSVDVQAAVASCLQSLDTKSAARRAPVEILLPSISVPSVD